LTITRSAGHALQHGVCDAVFKLQDPYYESVEGRSLGGSEKPVDRHGAFLPGACVPILGLRIDQRLPGGRVIEHVIGRRQVDADTRSHHADKRPARRIPLKTRPNFRHVFRGVPVQAYRIAPQASARLHHIVEHIGDNPEWREKIQAFAVEYRNINLRLCDSQSYATIPEGIFPDIVVVDGVYRTECIEWVLEHLLRPFTLIVDNWQQPGVYVDPKSDKLLEDIPGRIHSQVGYAVPTHMPWQTGIWKIR
jgi:hypothetical protein